MQGTPSRTAWSVARRRAAHQMLDRPLVLDDPLAVRIVGGDWQPNEDEQPVVSVTFRSFMAVRSRYAEDQLAAAYSNGVRRCVILGAGLDTFAYRNPWPDLHVLEVDHPATQEWKRELLSRAQIPIPPNVTFVPVNFETDDLRQKLGAEEAAFFPWLGVTPYLSREAFDLTIRFIGSLPEHTGVVFDYVPLPSMMSETQRRGLEALAARVARAGEPFRLFFDPAQLADDLCSAGFTHIEDLDSNGIHDRYFANRSDDLTVKGGAAHLLCAIVGQASACPTNDTRREPPALPSPGHRAEPQSQSSVRSTPAQSR
jgi:methyltransferase (TIGR00027 family)